MLVDTSGCCFLVLNIILLEADHTSGFFWPQVEAPAIKVIDLDYDSKNPLKIIGQQTKTIFLSCRIESSEEFTWKWKHDGEEINTPPPYIIPWKFGSVLMVRPLLKGVTDGKYDCIAKNRYLTIVGTVDISVEKDDLLPDGFPQIVNQPVDVRTRRVSVDFNCKVSGKPPLHITWYQNRNPILFDSVYEVSNVAYGDGLFASNLRIKNTTEASNGVYLCVATNNIGQAVSNDAQILFGKSRKKRFIQSTPSSTCFHHENKTHSAGPIDRNSIRVQCVEIANDTFMNIDWDVPKHSDKVEYYLITISNTLSQDPQNVLCFNTTKEVSEFKFDRSKGFQASSEDLYMRYQITIDTYPSPGDNTEIVNVGACPRLGKLSEWGSWGECNCEKKCEKDKDVCYGSKHQTRTCFSVHEEGEELEDYDCLPVKDNKRDCHVKCDGVVLRSPTSLPSTEDATKVRYEFILAGVCGAVVVIALVVFAMRNRKHPHPHTLIPLAGQTNVYISYLAVPHKEERLLNLIHFISGFDIHCVVDLLSQVEINNSGGLPNWLPSKISNADKILVVLSNTYIKALNSIEDGLELVPDKVCKVHTEFNLIKTIMYHSCQRTPQLVIVLDGVKKEDIPNVFRGRHHCLYPKKFEMDDDSCRNLMGLLLDEEPLQIVSNLSE